MKLQKFDASNSKSVRTGEPTINFNMAGGICFSKTFCQKIGLKKGDKVSIVQDEDQPEDWYIIIGDKDGFPIRENTGEGCAFNNAFICKNFIEHLQINAKSVNCKLATEPADIPKDQLPKGAKAYALLTATAKYVELKDGE